MTLHIKYFGRCNKKHYVINLYDYDSGIKYAFLVLSDFSSVFKGEHREKLCNDKELDVLLAAKPGAAQYPKGFRQQLEIYKQNLKPIAELEAYIDSDAFYKKLMVLAQTFPQEIREYLRAQNQPTPTKQYSRELMQVMTEHHQIFYILKTSAKLLPIEFNEMIEFAKMTVNDVAPLVPRYTFYDWKYPVLASIKVQSLKR